MIWATQPRVAVPVRPDLLPIGGINPGGWGWMDTSGAALTIGTGLTSSQIPEQGALPSGAVAIDGTVTNGALKRAVSYTDHPFSLVAVCSPDGTASVLCISSLATAADKLVRVFITSSGGAQAQHLGATTNASAITTQACTFGDWIACVAVFASPTDVRCYARGNFAWPARAQSTTNVGALGTLNKLAFFAYDGSLTANQFDGRIALAQWFRRAFTDAEAFELLRNPWSIFEPLPLRTRMPLVSVAGGVSPLVHGGLTRGALLRGGRLVA